VLGAVGGCGFRKQGSGFFAGNGPERHRGFSKTHQ
jgi:hypothetical protein